MLLTTMFPTIFARVLMWPTRTALVGVHKSIGAAHKHTNPDRESAHIACTKHTCSKAESALGGFGFLLFCTAFFVILRRIRARNVYNTVGCVLREGRETKRASTIVTQLFRRIERSILGMLFWHNSGKRLDTMLLLPALLQRECAGKLAHWQHIARGAYCVVYHCICVRPL